MKGSIDCPNIYGHPPPRTYMGKGVYHICIFIFIFQIVARAKTTVNTSVFWIHYVKNKFYCIHLFHTTPNTVDPYVKKP